MSPEIEFAKLSGSGNDFLCIDNRDGRYDGLLADPPTAAHFARALCRRGLSVGADGIIFASINGEFGEFADVSAIHFEPDGSQAELCGNGVACFTRWVVDNGWIDSGEVKILTTAGVVRGKRLDDGYVRACIPLPEDIRRNFTVQFDDTLWQCDYAVTGVPHLVTYVDDVDALDLPAIGPTLRYHPQFAPRGVNVNFVQVLGEGHIALRTWEFGVEGETLACGTGSSAAAILAALRFDWPQAYRSNDKPVLVKARSGDTLRIYFDMTADGRIADLCLETIVRFVYLGRLHGDLAAAALNPGPT